MHKNENLLSKISDMINKNNNLLLEIIEILNKKEIKKYNIKEHENIKGLYICENIITEDEEHNLLCEINKKIWLTDLSRRVQHYGYKYDYKKRKIDKNDYVGNYHNGQIF
jgi:hypothetical protein